MIHECTNCARTTATGLVLRPSGKTFDKHTVSPTGDEICKGGKPQEVQPTQAISVTPKTGKVACLECGEEHKALKTPGKVMKHTNPYTLDVCKQRPDATVACPAGCERPDIAMRLGKLAQHKNMALNTRCPGSNKTPTEAAAVKVEPIARPQKKAAPKQRSADAESYKALSARGKSELKAKRLADSVAQYGWTAAYGGKDGTVTLVLSRGKGADEEQMKISWFDGACIGGDGKITHTYRGRTVAVRNASAVKQRAALSQEEIEKEHKRVSTRKTVRGPRKVKTPAEQRLLLPFDPKTADDATILKAVLGKTIVWENKMSGKTQHGLVKSPKISKPKNGGRNLTFTGPTGSTTVRLENLVSVG